MYLAYRQEPNLRFHLFAAACAWLVAYGVKVSPWEVAYLAMAITAVWVAELVNTAVERAVDLAAGGRRHPLAAVAKEVAAGAVLVAALHAAFAGVYLFAVQRSLLTTAQAVWYVIEAQPWVLGIPVMTALSGVWAGREHH
jgi:diacylglycerol kinase